MTLGATTTGIDFELALGGLISGTVTDESSHTALDDGYIDIFDAGGTWVTSGWTDDTGNYISSAGLPSGAYIARTWSFDAYDEQLYSGISCALICTITDGTPITVTLGSTSGGIDFALGQSVFADGFESGDHSEWSRTVL